MPNFKKSTGFKMKGFSYPGESPITKSPYEINNFGIGPGASPYRETIDRQEFTVSGDAKDNSDPSKQSSADQYDEEETFGSKAKRVGKKALDVGVAALTSGLDAVYGSGKVMKVTSPSDIIKKKKTDKVVDEEGDNIAQSIIKGEDTNEGTAGPDETTDEE